ncbi:MAG: winged helix-turn-helix transcriptional regulator [Alphaproteobacteria bacterium]|nr:winged helix-turn-helix transcriptional regulator [Alphaproteobacteria bacterium]
MSIAGKLQGNEQTGGRLTCPSGRRSKPTKEAGGRQIVDLSTYTPYFLTAVTNAISRGASQIYLKMFGIGIVEWRVISMLAIEPRITAKRICDVIYQDKSGTSRALKHLLAEGNLAFEAPEADPRRKIWWLNDRGYDLHDRILEIALARERELIEGVDPDDLEAFLRVIRRMRQNVDKLGMAREDGA